MPKITHCQHHLLCDWMGFLWPDIDSKFSRFHSRLSTKMQNFASEVLVLIISFIPDKASVSALGLTCRRLNHVTRLRQTRRGWSIQQEPSYVFVPRYPDLYGMYLRRLQQSPLCAMTGFLAHHQKERATLFWKSLSGPLQDYVLKNLLDCFPRPVALAWIQEHDPKFEKSGLSIVPHEDVSEEMARCLLRAKHPLIKTCQSHLRDLLSQDRGKGIVLVLASQNFRQLSKMLELSVKFGQTSLLDELVSRHKLTLTTRGPSLLEMASQTLQINMAQRLLYWGARHPFPDRLCKKIQLLHRAAGRCTNFKGDYFLNAQSVDTA
jgi:hypothetical protein